MVDNASADGSAAMVAATFPSAVLVASERNLGFAAASNLGLARAHGRRLLLLNPDTEVRPGRWGRCWRRWQQVRAWPARARASSTPTARHGTPAFASPP